MTQESLSSSRLPADSTENSRVILAITRTSARSNMLVMVSRRKTMNSGCPFGRLTFAGQSECGRHRDPRIWWSAGQQPKFGQGVVSERIDAVVGRPRELRRRWGPVQGRIGRCGGGCPDWFLGNRLSTLTLDELSLRHQAFALQHNDKDGSNDHRTTAVRVMTAHKGWRLAPFAGWIGPTPDSGTGFS